MNITPAPRAITAIKPSELGEPAQKKYRGVEDGIPNKKSLSSGPHGVSSSVKDQEKLPREICDEHQVHYEHAVPGGINLRHVRRPTSATAPHSSNWNPFSIRKALRWLTRVRGPFRRGLPGLRNLNKAHTTTISRRGGGLSPLQPQKTPERCCGSPCVTHTYKPKKGGSYE